MLAVSLSFEGLQIQVSDLVMFMERVPSNLSPTISEQLYFATTFFVPISVIRVLDLIAEHFGKYYSTKKGQESFDPYPFKLLSGL